MSARVGYLLAAVGVVVSLALVAAALVVAHTLIGAKDSPYTSNRRAARELGTPTAFAPQSEQDVGGGKARKTFVRSCGAPCAPQQLRDAAVAVGSWLRTKPGIQSIVPVLSQDGTTVMFTVRSTYRPPISRVELVLSQAGKILLQIDVG